MEKDSILKISINLWKQMADLTFAKCKEHCHSLGSCCSEGDCQVTQAYALSKGVELKPTGNKIPFLGSDNKCIVPPHLRPFCTLHQCKIASIGFDVKDPKWTKDYFDLRQKLDELLEGEENEENRTTREGDSFCNKEVET